MRYSRRPNSIRHPVSEHHFGSDGEHGHPQVAQQNADARTDAQVSQRVGRLQRVVEKSTGIVNAGQPRAREQIRAEHRSPQIPHKLHLREEPVSTDVESEPVVLDRLRQPADAITALEHQRRHLPLHELVRGRQASWTSTDDDDRRIRSARTAPRARCPRFVPCCHALSIIARHRRNLNLSGGEPFCIRRLPRCAAHSSRTRKPGRSTCRRMGTSRHGPLMPRVRCFGNRRSGCSRVRSHSMARGTITTDFAAQPSRLQKGGCAVGCGLRQR